MKTSWLLGMIKQPRFLWFWGCIALLFTFNSAVMPTEIQAGEGIFLSVQESSEGEEPLYWWGESPPRWTESDHVLMEVLRSSGGAPIDPSKMASPPRISQRVFGSPQLSDTNALNLASIFNAAFLITGESRVSRLAPRGYQRAHGARVSLSLKLYALQNGALLFPIKLTAAAHAPTPAQAKTLAIQKAMRRVEALLQSSGVLGGEKALEIGEPLLVLEGLEQARPLVEIKRHLKKRGDIHDVLEFWSAEGVIAVEINPGTEDPPERLSQAVEGLLKHSFEDFKVLEIKRDKGEIRLQIQAKSPEITQ